MINAGLSELLNKSLTGGMGMSWLALPDLWPCLLSKPNENGGVSPAVWHLIV